MKPAFDAPKKTPRNPPQLWRQFGLVSRLGLIALGDEVLFTTCLVGAIAAVIAPVMVLAALKFGFIEIKRSQLIQDPSYRLIEPTEARPRSASFFDALRSRRDVAFVQETASLSRTGGELVKTGELGAVSVDLIYTSAGDPVILENGGRVPADDEIVLSSAAAAKAGLKAGDGAVLRFSRTARGRVIRQDIPLTVAAVLPPRASTIDLVWLKAGLVDDIEMNKMGVPIPARGWAGDPRPPAQTFERAVLGLKEPLDEAGQRILASQYSFDLPRPMEAGVVRAETGLAFDDYKQILSLDQGGAYIPGVVIDQMLRDFGARPVAVIPVVSAISAMIGEKLDRRIDLLAADPADLQLAVTEGDVGGWKAWESKMPFGEVDRIALPAQAAQALGITVGSRIDVKILPVADTDSTRDLAIRLVVDALVDGERAFVPAGLAGMLHESRQSKVVYDSVANALAVSSAEHRGFRLYARTIDDVPNLVKFLSQGEKPELVNSRSAMVEQLQRLDGALTQIVMLVGAVALIGGAVVLVASFYGAVERKEGELALLRLMGFERLSVFQFPLVQAFFVASLGFVLAALLYATFAMIINTYFAADLQVGEHICRLPLQWWGIFFAGSLALSALASFAGGVRATRIDPAEALRRE
jgi:putative ABC transport system permease protein